MRICLLILRMKIRWRLTISSHFEISSDKERLTLLLEEWKALTLENILLKDSTKQKTDFERKSKND